MLPKIDFKSLKTASVADKRAVIEDLIRKTGRVGAENVIGFLSSTDFYSAPASTKYHSSYKEGLINHCLTVLGVMDDYRQAWIKNDPSLAQVLTDDKLIVCSLLHDICKTNLYVQQEKMTKNERGDWTTTLGYVCSDSFPIGHGEKSVIMLQAIGFNLFPDEMLAIRYHMGFWGDLGEDVNASLQKAIEMSPLVTLMQVAEFTASNVFETRNFVNK